MNRAAVWLGLGDTAALAATTLIGFATHGELSATLLSRMLTTFLPLLAGWFLIAPWLGLFDPAVTRDPRQLWRPPLAMLLGAPLTGVLRAALLRTAALPLFVLILGGSAAMVLLLWRLVYYLLSRRRG
jgi:hypothetical protein